MAGKSAITLQSNIKKYNGANMRKYSLFLGGLNVTNRALAQYDPLKTGYNRIFFVQMPEFMKIIMPEETKQIKHLMEYGFVGIDGIQNLELEFEQITGGYAGRSFEIPTVAKDNTNSLTIKLYEFGGSPVREYNSMWISGIADQYTGFCRYHGLVDPQIAQSVYGQSTPLDYAQHNHTAEAIYIATDPTGDKIEYACQLCNMVPKQAKMDHFNYESGSHQSVQTDIEFTATKYESPQVNALAQYLLKKYKVMTNFMNFHSGYKLSDINDPSKFPETEIENFVENIDPKAGLSDGTSSTITGRI